MSKQKKGKRKPLPTTPIARPVSIQANLASLERDRQEFISKLEKACGPIQQTGIKTRTWVVRDN